MDIFMGYAKHQQEIEDTINNITNYINRGGREQVILNPDNDFTQEELDYISKRVNENIN